VFTRGRFEKDTQGEEKEDLLLNRGAGGDRSWTQTKDIVAAFGSAWVREAPTSAFLVLSSGIDDRKVCKRGREISLARGKKRKAEFGEDRYKALKYNAEKRKIGWAAVTALDQKKEKVETNAK